MDLQNSYSWAVAGFRLQILILCTSVFLALPVEAQLFTAKHYELELKPDFESRLLAGKARIVIEAGNGTAGTLVLNSPRLHISRASLNGNDLAVRKYSEGWHIPLIEAQTQVAPLRLEVEYRASATPGLVFGEGYVYTAFHTCRWMPCVGTDLGRAGFALSLDLPEGYRSVASGQRLEESEPGKHQWRQSQPYPLYTLGFAAGRFSEVMDSAGGHSLRYLSLYEDKATLRKKFIDSARMLAFFEDKGGLPLPHPVYTQVLLPGGVAQEASSFSLIGTRMLDPILDDPQEDWVISHEMAHQWWGNLITCATWSDLWLNEGITVFMTAAWKQHRWGESAYQRELVLARKSWRGAKELGFDKPLSWKGEYPSLKIKRAVHYSKGALFMDALRRELGEQAFWEGFRRYTKENAGRSVTAGDLQVAMEQSAGRSLRAIFEAWVY